MTMKAASGDGNRSHNVAYKDKSKPADIRNSNINAQKVMNVDEKRIYVRYLRNLMHFGGL